MNENFSPPKEGYFRSTIHAVYSDEYFTLYTLLMFDKEWMILTSNKENRLPATIGIFRCWSHNLLEPIQNSKSAHEVASEICEMLQSVDVKEQSSRNSLTLFPKGWEFWGGGVPNDLDDYLVAVGLVP